MLEQMKNTLNEHTTILEATKSTAGRLVGSMYVGRAKPWSPSLTVSRKHFLSLGTELKALMTRIWTLNFRSYNILLELQTRVPPEFEPCWIQEPLILTDALGRVAPVHLELINSWTVLESVLEARFHKIPGERKIKRREYALQDRSSQLDIERSASFESCFLPGLKVDMSMVFKGGSASGASCPGCGLESGRENTVAAIWYAMSTSLMPC
jgi:hypothetical protein